jgi:hypothetical protein
MYSVKQPTASKEVERAGIREVSADSAVAEAYQIIHGERAAHYGKAEDSFAAIGLVWTGLLANKLGGNSITAEDVAILMTGLKLARQQNQHKRDNVVDAFGYLLLLDRMTGTGRG